MIVVVTAITEKIETGTTTREIAIGGRRGER